MTTLNISRIRSSEVLNLNELYTAVGLLASIAEVSEDPQATLAYGTLKAMLKNIEDTRLGTLLDWWLVVRFGEKSQGPAFRIDDLEDDLPLGSMSAAREYSQRMGAPCIPLIRRRRQLDDALRRLERELHHEQGKVGSQGVTWDKIEALYRPSFESLMRGVTCDSPKVTKQEIRSIMNEHAVRTGSEIWRKIERDWSELDKVCEEACGLATAEVLTYSGPLPEPRPRHTSERPAEHLLVEQLLLGDFYDGQLEPTTVFDQCSSGVGIADPLDLEWFASLTLPYQEATDRSLPRVTKDHQRIRAATKALANLAKREIDTAVAQILLAEGSITAAEEAIEEANSELRRDDRRRTLESRLQQFARDAALLDCDADYADALDLVRADIQDGALEDALDRMRELEDDLRDRKKDDTQTRAVEFVDQLQRLGAPVAESLRQRALAGDIDEHELAELRDRAEQAHTALSDTIEKRLESTEIRLESEGQLLDQATRESVQLLLDQGRDECEAGDLITADEKVRRALTILDQSVPRAWTSELGESVLVQHLRKYVTDRLGFESDDIDRLYVGLKTKKFAILSGVTGSGKSTIARMFAEALGATAGNGRFVRVAVRPNWVDESDVIGYLNPVSQRFEPGWLTTLIRECEQTPDVPLFCLLDEMNLAPVEYYLADYLSALEEAAAGVDAFISLYPRSASPTNVEQWPHQLRFPPNLFLIGTVNVDESTRALSDRVLDRANVFQLSVTVTDRHHRVLSGDSMEPRWQIRMRDWNTVCAPTPSDEYHNFLLDLGEVLNGSMRLGLGVRAHIEIERFVANSKGVIPANDALDVALLQRVIPKIRGFRRDLADGLADLRVLFDERSLARCLAVVTHWLADSTSDDDFIDGTHGVVGLVTSRPNDD